MVNVSKKLPFCSLFFFFLFFFFSSWPVPVVIEARGSSSGGIIRRSVDVGVILDRKTWIGNISWSCMLMALDDFYAAHPNYNTKLSFHLRDTDQTAFGAAAAALDLLKNVQVQVIIGPQTSTQAKFLIDLGDKIHVPIISFSAKSPSLSPQRSPYFIRTTINDSSQTQVIASIIQAFKWRAVVPIFEDTEYGNGIVPDLIDALLGVEANVPYQCSLPAKATKDQIMKELDKLKNMSTRVFVVHMSYGLGFQLFSNAKQAGMMGEGYVWIVTYGLIDLVDLIDSANVMQGVLGVKPYVSNTKKLNNFKSRWRNTFHQENSKAKVDEPTTFGLWAYDTVWSLAMAVENVKLTNSTLQEQNSTNNSTDLATLIPSLSGPILLSQILNTKFNGLAGKFHLIDGQLESKAFEVVNVVGNAKKIIGYWTPENGTSANLDSKTDLHTITWPGGKNVAPKGWEWPTNGRQLRIGLPVKPGFHGFVRTENGTAQGYCIEVFEAVLQELPYNITPEYIPYNDSKGDMNGTYDDLIYQVYLQNFDAVVGDVTIIANRSLYVDFTLPYTESGVLMLVPVRDQWQTNAWTFLEPLATDLWLASGVFFILTGFVVWVMEHRINDDFRGTPLNQLGTVFYFAFSTLVFAHREKIASNLSRIVVIIWVFVVLILQSSYTASLTSLLTVQELQPTVTDIDELIKSGSFVGYLNDSFMPSLLKRMNFNESKLIPFKSPNEYNEALTNGTVAAILDEIPYIKVFLSKFCNNYTTTGPTYKTDGFGFVFPKGSPMVQDVSRAILKVTEGKKMAEIENRLYGNRNCSLQGDTSATSSSLTIKSFWGLFLITGITSFSAVLIHLAFFVHKHRHLLRPDDDSLTSIWQRLASLAKVYDHMDPSRAAPKKPEEHGGPNNKVPVMGEIMLTPFTISGPQSPSSISNYALENSELEEVGTPSDDDEEEEEEEEDLGREIRRENPDQPSFAEMVVTERA